MQYNKSYYEDLKYLFSNDKNVFLLNGKSIFITGATGLIGSALADYLLYMKKHQTLNIDIYLGGRDNQKICKRFSAYSEGTDFHYLEYDALKKINIHSSFNYIIHCAGYGDPTAIHNFPVETILTNIQGLYDLLQYAQTTSVEKLLFVSSSEVYGQTDKQDAHYEDIFGIINPSNPRNCYPLSKKCGENLCISFSKEYDLNTLIVRPGHIYGPQMTEKDSRATAQFFRNVINGNDIIMKSSGAQLRSYCYSLDCASAILNVLLKGKENEAYNISNRDSICTIREFAEELALQTKHKIIFENPTDAENKSYNLMQNSSLNSEKLEALGWNACFSLKKGVESTLMQF